jgi:hypothetical protein
MQCVYAHELVLLWMCECVNVLKYIRVRVYVCWRREQMRARIWLRNLRYERLLVSDREVPVCEELISQWIFEEPAAGMRTAFNC